jgi:hypothetical protein
MKLADMRHPCDSNSLNLYQRMSVAGELPGGPVRAAKKQQFRP